MNKVRLGKTGPDVFPLALGCMGMSGMYGQTNDDDGVSTIRAAVERGVNLIDTGDFYGMGHNELLVGRALRGLRDKVHVSVNPGPDIPRRSRRRYPRGITDPGTRHKLTQPSALFS